MDPETLLAREVSSLLWYAEAKLHALSHALATLLLSDEALAFAVALLVVAALGRFGQPRTAVPKAVPRAAAPVSSPGPTESRLQPRRPPALDERPRTSHVYLN